MCRTIIHHLVYTIYILYKQVIKMNDSRDNGKMEKNIIAFNI